MRPQQPGGSVALPQPPTSQQVIVISVCITLLVSLYSLSELQTLIAAAGRQDGAFLPAHHDWATVEHIAERAVAHVEHLPGRRAGHATAVAAAFDTFSQTTAAGAGAPAAAAAAAAATQLQPASTSSPPSSSVTGTYPPPAKECHAMEFTELWGDVVKWGSAFHVSTPGECCEACLKHKPPDRDAHPCNVWVWCGVKEYCGSQYQECWLKHLVRPATTKPAREGPDVGWTSGVVGPDADELEARDKEEAAEPKKVRKFHIITSAQGSAVHWQVRIHYYWYLKQKAECEKTSETCDMGGFTRLLHSGEPDDLMDEVPTFVASPLPDSVVPHELYPVLNRPYAFLQWIQQANISEEYVLMSEPDHIFLAPLPNLMRRDDAPAAMPYFYIEPHTDENLPITAKFVPGGALSKAEAELIAPIGNSPTFMSMAQMRKVVPLWQNLSVAIFTDKQANEKWGWVQEMYAFTISLYVSGIRHVDLALQLMAQPPWDAKMQLTPKKPFLILHYTYGNDYSISGRHMPGKFGTWRFDKRTYVAKPPPRYLGQPPAAMQNDLVRALISHINEASAAIPCWDEYYRTGVKPATCAEVIPGSMYPAAARPAQQAQQQLQAQQPQRQPG